jgi:hypothetical protein
MIAIGNINKGKQRSSNASSDNIKPLINAQRLVSNSYMTKQRNEKI